MTAVSEMFVLIIAILVALQHCGQSHHHSHKGHSHHHHGSRFHHHHNHRHPYRRSSSLFHPHYHTPPTLPFPFYNLPYLFNSPSSLHTRSRCKSRRRRIIMKVPYPIIHKVPIYKQIAIPLNVPIKVPLKLNFNIKTEKNGSNNKKANYQATYDEEEAEDHGTTNADNGLQSIDPQHAQPSLYPFLYNPSDNSLLPPNDGNSELTKNFNVQLNSEANNQEIESDENDSKQLIKLGPKDYENEEHNNNKKSLFELSQPGRYSSVTLGKMYRQLNDRYYGMSNPDQKTLSSNDKELDDNGEEIESYSKDINLSENDLQTDPDEDGNNNQGKANLNDDEESDETNSFASRTSGYDNNNDKKNSKINNNQINSNFVQSNYQTS